MQLVLESMLLWVKLKSVTLKCCCMYKMDISYLKFRGQEIQKMQDYEQYT